MNDTDAALRKKVFALRRKGWEYASIQKTLGIGYNTTRRIAKRFDQEFGPPAIRVRIPKKKGQVGVREVRMNFKNYLDQVKGGVSFQIVQRGRVVARIVPDHD